jgi:hypothetical protein
MDHTYHHIAALFLFALGPNCCRLEDAVEEWDLFVVDHPGPDIFFNTCRTVLEVLQKGLNIAQRLYTDVVPERHHSSIHLL